MASTRRLSLFQEVWLWMSVWQLAQPTPFWVWMLLACSAASFLWQRTHCTLPTFTSPFMCLASSTISMWQLVQPFLPCTEFAIRFAEILSPWQPRQVAGSMARPCWAATGWASTMSNSRGMKRVKTRTIGNLL